VFLNRFDRFFRFRLCRRKRRGRSHGSDRGRRCLDREVVYDGLDAGDLRDICGSERAGSLAADIAVEGDDAVLNARLYGFIRECAVS
jgi:hypothetical protein